MTLDEFQKSLRVGDIFVSDRGVAWEIRNIYFLSCRMHSENNKYRYIWINSLFANYTRTRRGV